MRKPTSNKPPATERVTGANERRTDTAVPDPDDRQPPMDAGEKDLDDASSEAIEEEVAEESGGISPGPGTFLPLGGAPRSQVDDSEKDPAGVRRAGPQGWLRVGQKRLQRDTRSSTTCSILAALRAA
jgi:hypothetical protein